MIRYFKTKIFPLIGFVLFSAVLAAGAGCGDSSSKSSLSAELTGLVLSSGTITPNFSAGTASYAAAVAFSVDSITVTPTAADSGATVAVNGTAVSSGIASGEISLSEGINKVEVLVSRSGKTKTYTVDVTRGTGAEASIGADGYASYSTGTIGGASADSLHQYIVTNRNELIKALYTDVVMSSDGTWTGKADTLAKIVYVKGTINLCVDGNNNELKEADFIAAVPSASSYTSDAYVAAYKPSVWNAANWNSIKPKTVSGTLESMRSALSSYQSKIVKTALPSNTSLLGLGTNAKIIKGQLSIGAGTDNVVIRNIEFQDSFDYFPVWDPTDSFQYDATKEISQMLGGHWNANYDNIGLSGGMHVWIDHCTISDGDREDHSFPSVFEEPHIGVDYVVEHHDGAIDIGLTSDYVTVSNNHIKNHDKSHLIGSSDTVSTANGWGYLHVTLHDNWWENAGQRLPRVRLGYVHVYNNYYSGQIGYPGQYQPSDTVLRDAVPNNRFLYGIGIGFLAKIYSENNSFEIKDSPTGAYLATVAVTFYTWHKTDPTTGLAGGSHTYFYDSGTTLNGSAVDMVSAAQAAATAAGKPALYSTPEIWKPSSVYSYTPKVASEVKVFVTANAGAGIL
jgi:pectate lyase